MTGVLTAWLVVLLTIVAGQGAAIHTWIRRAETQRRRAEAAERRAEAAEGLRVDELMAQAGVSDFAVWEYELTRGDE